MINKTFADQARTMVQESLFTKYSMLCPASTDYKVIEAKASKAIQEAIKTYLDENPMERQATIQQSQNQSQAANGNAPEQNTDPQNQKSWETMFRAMKSVSTDDKADGLKTAKYAIAFFKILTISKAKENNLPNNGQTSEFESSDVNRLLKAGISAKLNNMNTWNMQKDHLCNAMADKESLSYQNLKPLLNNADFMVKLKGYDFVCSSLKLNTNCKNISLGSFTPMDKDNNSFKDMKQNNVKTNIQHQLGHKGKHCTKASTKVWCDWRIT
jgi:flagellar biosynthesis GTPase FlhF